MKLFKSIIGLFVFVNLSCSESSKEIVIDFWGLGSEGEFVKLLIPKFEAENPGIKVKVQMAPWTAAQEKLISAFASDNLPDVFQLGNTWIPQFAQLDGISELSEFIHSSKIINKENYFSGIWDTNVLDSLVFGIPWYIDTRVLFYRKDVFEKAGFTSPPKTWNELYKLSKKIKANHKGEEKYAIFIATNEWANFIIFGLQNGAEILKNNNTYANFSSDKFTEAFSYLVNYYKEKLTPLGVSQVTNVYQAFAEEYFSMYISGPWNINEFKKWMTGSLQDKWSTAALPGPNENIKGVSLAGGSSLVISQKSKHKKEAWKLIEYLSKPETQIEFYHLVNDLPAVKEAWKDSSLSNNIYMKAFYEQFNYVVATPKIPEWEQIVFSKLQQYVELAARNVLTVKEALKKLDDDVNVILEKRRWMLSK
ncbi:MAG: sugar ABC transporter substrate-binding protein [Ignavibacteriaceae bacterium]|nr:sugar ABC transporter substrate-binding protein [Ignavibacteriaceae bacterium]